MKKGFTLMELLVVMAIITILAGMAIGGAQMARKRGGVTKTQSTIAALEAAIDMYEMDIGSYPAAGSLLTALTDENSQPAEWNGPYLRVKEEDLIDGQYVDAWGNPYAYINPGTHNKSYYDIYSFGLDGQDNQGAGDDINNW